MDSYFEQSKSLLFTLGEGGAQSVTDSDEQDRRFILPAGAIVDRRYMVMEILGKGGMGAVYRVHHLQLKKEMALKTFLTSDIRESSWLRFQREAKAIARLDHPNVVKIFDFGIDYTQNRNLPFYTMELLKGQSLSDRLSRHNRFSPVDTLKIFRQVADGLAAVHGNGIVHGDIKPANIFLDTHTSPGAALPLPRLVDFGIASLVAEMHEEQEQYEEKLFNIGERLTEPVKEIFGSPLYMSPEQCRGKKLTFASDIYSYACTLYEALSGQLPFFATTARATMKLHVGEEAPPLSSVMPRADIPQRLDYLMAAMLSKEPDARLQSFQEVSAELETLAQIFAERSQIISALVTGYKTDGDLSPGTSTNELSFSPRQTSNLQLSALRHNGNSTLEQTIEITGGRALIYIAFSVGLLAVVAVSALILKSTLLTPPKQAAVKPTFVNERFDSLMQTAGEVGNLAQRKHSGNLGKNLNNIASISSTGDNASVDLEPQPAAAIKIEPLSFDLSSEEDKKNGRRTFNFPSTQSMGTFIWTEAGRHREQEARGHVQIPFEHCFCTSINISAHPEYLTGFKTDSLYGFTQLKNENFFFNDKHLHQLARLTGLRIVTLKNAPISREGVKELNNLPHLKELHLRKCSISARDLFCLKRIKEMDTLEISGLNDGGDLLEYFAPLPKLETLYACGCQLEDRHLKLLPGSPKLVILDLGQNPEVTDRGLPELLALHELTRLNLGQTYVTPASIPILTKLRTLKKLSVDSQLWKIPDVQKLKDQMPPQLLVDGYD